jgi:hypothetical protein
MMGGVCRAVYINIINCIYSHPVGQLLTPFLTSNTLNKQYSDEITLILDTF